MLILIVKSGRKKYRKGYEYGSARWGDVETVRPYLESTKDKSLNLIFSGSMKLGITKEDLFRHRKNLNVLVDGGSGAGKSLNYVLPNLLQYTDMKEKNSVFVLDPKKETCSRTGEILRERGYRVRILDLLDFDKSFGYNPLKYIRDDHVDEDVQILVTNIFKASSPEQKGTLDPFWDNSAAMLLKALILYVYYTCDIRERTLKSVNLILRYSTIGSQENTTKNAVDVLFDELRAADFGNSAVAYYDLYRDGDPKTLKSIKLTLVTKLEKFLIPAIERLTSFDEMELDMTGREKTAIFACIPDNDTSFNMLVSILYTQLFQQLFKNADSNIDHRLESPVHFIMDEFANVELPPDFPVLLSVMRSRGISVSIIIQNISQLKKLFEKEWESVIGNCDTFLYLGGNEKSTHKYVSELLGRETIDTQTYTRSKGKSGSYSKNDQKTGRDLMSSAEVRLLKSDECIIFINGELPLKDKKYRVFDDSRIKYTTLGGYREYKSIKRYHFLEDVFPIKAKQGIYTQDDIQNMILSLRDNDDEQRGKNT